MLLLRTPESVSHPWMTLENSSRVNWELYEVIEEATPWVLEVLPVIVSLTTKLSLDVIFRIPILLSQLSTVPLAEFEVTI